MLITPEIFNPTSREDLANRSHHQRKFANFRTIFQQKEIDEALAEQYYLEEWTSEHFTDVRNALQTLQLSINNLFVAIGFINSLESTLRKAVILTLFNSKVTH